MNFIQITSTGKITLPINHYRILTLRLLSVSDCDSKNNPKFNVAIAYVVEVLRIQHFIGLTIFFNHFT